MPKAIAGGFPGQHTIYAPELRPPSTVEEISRLRNELALAKDRNDLLERGANAYGISPADLYMAGVKMRDEESAVRGDNPGADRLPVLVGAGGEAVRHTLENPADL